MFELGTGRRYAKNESGESYDLVPFLWMDCRSDLVMRTIAKSGSTGLSEMLPAVQSTHVFSAGASICSTAKLRRMAGRRCVAN